MDTELVQTEPTEERFAPSLKIADRIPELDGIRGLAALLVVFHHVSQCFPPPLVSRPFAAWIAVTRVGWLGVDVFFALSGFLITRILLETRNRPRYYRNFYARRILRLAPPYLLILLFVAFLIPHSGSFLLLSLVYLANFAKPFGIPQAYGPLWSLAIEEHFYLVWPWMVRFLRRRTLFVVALAVCLFTPAFRWYAQQHGFFDLFYSWFRFDGLLWGAGLAVLITSPRATRRGVWLWSTVVGSIGAIGFIAGAVLGYMSRLTVAGNTFAFGLVAMATTGLIGHVALESAPRLFAPLRHPVLRFFGDISYWLYLFHELAVRYTLRLETGWSKGWEAYFVLLATVLGSSILTGVVVRRWIASPC